MYYMHKIAVIGDGGWGTTLAMLLSDKGEDVRLWSVSEEYAEVLRSTRQNHKYLPGFEIPEQIKISSSMEEVFSDAEVAVLAVPSHFMRSVLRKMRKMSISDKIFLSVAKGIENETLKRPSEIVREVLGSVQLAVLSGPSIAPEVAAGVPSAVVIASEDITLAETLQNIFITERFRVYTNTDIIGTELGGALKNIIAVAAGISDGLGFGVNTKAAILTRGLAEIIRLAAAMGAQEKTLSGLAGIGDLATTCMSPQSRNRSLGERIGKGEKLKDILASMDKVAEGVRTVRSVVALSGKYNVELPIARQVYEVFYEDKNPLAAVDGLMRRQKKAE